MCSSDLKELSEKGYDYKRLQLMAPMYNGENGITNLNAELQSILNPYDKDKKELLYGDTTFRVGDKVIQLVNFQDLQIYNGDIGVILDIIDPGKSESKTHEFIIDFDGREVVIPSTHFSKLKHAFIISIHKSQGSEFEMVVMPICRSYNRMLYKKLVYTAITRAKRRLIIIGETDAFVTAVRINREYNRSTLLFHKINISLYKMSENG